MLRPFILATALGLAGCADGMDTRHAAYPHNLGGVQPCPIAPCNGIPPAAPGGGSGSGPSALREQPMDSPVATGAGSSSAKTHSNGP